MHAVPFKAIIFWSQFGPVLRWRLTGSSIIYINTKRTMIEQNVGMIIKKSFSKDDTSNNNSMVSGIKKIKTM